MLDSLYDAGGDFIDTSKYPAGESETWIGEWMEKRGVRDQIVLHASVLSVVPRRFSFVQMAI
jgi:aryl-alcohol dehydrogenase-like predicted oxidoreductase